MLKGRRLWSGVMTFVLLASLVIPVAASAAESESVMREIQVAGRVTDSVTGEAVDAAFISLLGRSEPDGDWFQIGFTGTELNGTYKLFVTDWGSVATLERRLQIEAYDYVGIHEHDFVAPSGTYRYDAKLTPKDPTAPSRMPLGGTRVAGSERYRTAVEASKQVFPKGFPKASAHTVIIATGENYADALSGAALAGIVEGPLLLTRKNELPNEVLGEIERLGAEHAYILGADGAVGPKVETVLRNKLGKDKVTRIAGATRYETAQRVAEKVISLLGDRYHGRAIVATGANFPDALGASPFATARRIPVLLADPRAKHITVPKGVRTAVITGGTGAVSTDVESALRKQLGDKNVTRLAGNDRFETAAAVAEYGVDEWFMDWNGTGLVTGLAFPDALAGGVMLGHFNSVMLLTRPNTLGVEAKTQLSAHTSAINTLFFLGGTSAISENVKRTAESAADIQGILPK